MTWIRGTVAAAGDNRVLYLVDPATLAVRQRIAIGTNPAFTPDRESFCELNHTTVTLSGSSCRVAIFVFSSIAGCLASLVWCESNIVVGASAGALGLAGALWVGRRFGTSSVQQKLEPISSFSLAFLVLLCLLLGAVIPWIAQAGHIGGLVMGLLLGLALVARSRVSQVLITAIAGALLVGTATLGGEASWRPAEYHQFLGLRALNEGDAPAAKRRALTIGNLEALVSSGGLDESGPNPVIQGGASQAGIARPAEPGRSGHHRIVPVAEIFERDPLERPYVLKPVNEGSSVGVAIVTAEGNYGNPINPQAKGPWQEFKELLAEPYIRGRELTTAVLAGVEGPRALMVTELRPKSGFYDFDAKYTEGMTEHVCPAEIPDEITRACLDIALRCHQLLGCKGCSRTDFRWDDEQGLAGLFVLETNTQPGMTPLSLVPEQAKHLGISYADLVEMIIADALAGKDAK